MYSSQESKYNFQFKVSSIKDTKGNDLVDMTTIKIMIASQIDAQSNEMTLDVDGYYKIHSDFTIKEEKYNIIFIENDMTVDPFSSIEIIFGSLKDSKYIFYKNSNILFNDVPCLFPNIQFKKEDEEPISLTCSSSESNVISCKPISESGEFSIIIQNTDTSFKSFVSIPINSEEVSFNFNFPNNVLVPGENSIEITSDNYYIHSINSITVTFNNNPKQHLACSEEISISCFSIVDKKIKLNFQITDISRHEFTLSFERIKEGDEEDKDVKSKEFPQTFSTSENCFGLSLEKKYIFIKDDTTNVDLIFTYTNIIPADIDNDTIR